MEEVDGLFSSPEKSPTTFHGIENEDNDSSIGSDGMSMDEGASDISILKHSGGLILC